MLTPEYLQGLPDELVALTENLETQLIEDIARRVAKAGEITDTAAYQIMRLKEMGASTEYIKKLLADYTKSSEDAIERMIFDAAQTDSEFYQTVYAKTGRSYVPYEYNDYLQQLAVTAVNQTKGELKNLTQSMGFAVRGSDGRVTFKPAAKAYQSAMDKAQMLVSTGGMDYITAVRMAVNDLAASGLRFVDYDSGIRNHADVAARRAILTGVSQMTGKIAEHNAAELGTDVVEVDAHAGARPDHAAWQGKWYSLTGKDKRYPLLSQATGYGTVSGLKGANCRHDFYPVIPGIDEPAYTEEELRNIDPPPVKIGDKTYTYYEAEQRQREMERAIRKTKRQIIAAQASGDTEQFTAKSVLLRRQREQYADFSKKAGLVARNERTQVAEFGRSAGSKSSWAARKAKTAKSGGSGSSGGHAVTVNVPTPADNGGKGKLYRDEGLDKSGGSGIMKMGKVKSAYKQNAPDFSIYEITEDIQSVNTVRNLLISEFDIAESNIDFSGIKNAEVLKPFSEQLVKIKNKTGLAISKIAAAEVIEGDECCIASYKPFERTLYISSRYFNSEKALTDTLKAWASNGIVPEQCTTIRYLAEHEAAHIRIPDDIIRNEEAIRIWKKRKLINDNDSNIYEYYADVVAIYNTSSNYDKNVQNAIDYLIKEGVKI